MKKLTKISTIPSAKKGLILMYEVNLLGSALNLLRTFTQVTLTCALP